MFLFLWAELILYDERVSRKSGRMIPRKERVLYNVGVKIEVPAVEAYISEEVCLDFLSNYSFKDLMNYGLKTFRLNLSTPSSPDKNPFMFLRTCAATEILIDVIIHFPIKYRRREDNRKSLDLCLLCVESLENYVPVSFPDRTADNFLLAIIRNTLAMNYRYYKNPLYEYSRSMLLFERFASNDLLEQLDLTPNLKDLFPYVAKCFRSFLGLYLVDKDSGFLVPLNYLSGDYETKKIIKEFLNLISRTKSQFENEFLSKRRQDSIWFPGIPLRKHPILRHKGGYCVPNPFNFLEYLNIGLFRDLTKIFCPDSSRAGQVGQVIGDDFFSYCYDVAEASNKLPIVKNIDDLISSVSEFDKSKPKADLLLVNAHICLIVECKSGRRWILEEKEAAYSHTVKTYLFADKEKVLRKFVETEMMLRKNFPEFIKDRKVIHVLLIPFEIPMFWFWPDYAQLQEDIDNRISSPYTLDQFVPMSIFEYETMLGSECKFEDGLGLSEYLDKVLEAKTTAAAIIRTRETHPTMLEHYKSNTAKNALLESYLDNLVGRLDNSG